VIDLEASDDNVEHNKLDVTSSISAHKGRVEPVSAVIGKYVLKATTAPPTIKNFFKPKQSESVNIAQMSESKPEGSVVSNDDRISDENDDDIVVIKTSDCEQFVNESCNLQPENSIRQTASSGCSAVTSRAATKRSKSGKKLPAGKKHKQSSIQASFSAANRYPEKRPAAMQCPICSRTFDENASNAEINQHIDNCLIE